MFFEDSFRKGKNKNIEIETSLYETVKRNQIKMMERRGFDIEEEVYLYDDISMRDYIYENVREEFKRENKKMIRKITSYNMDKIYYNPDTEKYIFVSYLQHKTIKAETFKAIKVKAFLNLFEKLGIFFDFSEKEAKKDFADREREYSERLSFIFIFFESVTRTTHYSLLTESLSAYDYQYFNHVELLADIVERNYHIELILEEELCDSSFTGSQLTLIREDDPLVKYFRYVHGDIIKIYRLDLGSNTPIPSIYYRKVSKYVIKSDLKKDKK